MNQIVENNEVTHNTVKHGDAGLTSADDYNDIMETLYLLGVPGLSERLGVSKNENAEENVPFGCD